MANKEKIDYLLLDIRELEKKVAGMRDAEIYPISFFSQSFELAHKILTDLHCLEAVQLEELSRQMEEHRLRLSAIPLQQAAEQPALKTEKEQPQPHEGNETCQEAVETIIIHHKEEKPAEEKTADRPVEETVQPIAETVQPSKEEVPVLRETFVEAKTTVSFNEILEKKNLSDFRKAFSLNDRFRFRRELFGGDESRMNQAINDLNDLHSYEESVTYLDQQLQWNIEDEAVADFLKLIEKRFS